MPTRVFLTPGQSGVKKKTHERPKSAVDRLRERVTISKADVQELENQINREYDSHLHFHKQKHQRPHHEGIVDLIEGQQSEETPLKSESTQRYQQNVGTLHQPPSIGSILHIPINQQFPVQTFSPVPRRKIALQIYSNVGQQIAPTPVFISKKQRTPSRYRFNAEFAEAALNAMNAESAVETLVSADEEKTLFIREHMHDLFVSKSAGSLPISSLRRPASSHGWREKAKDFNGQVITSRRASVNFARYLVTSDPEGHFADQNVQVPIEVDDRPDYHDVIQKLASDTMSKHAQETSVKDLKIFHVDKQWVEVTPRRWDATPIAALEQPVTIIPENMETKIKDLFRRYSKDRIDAVSNWSTGRQLSHGLQSNAIDNLDIEVKTLEAAVGVPITVKFDDQEDQMLIENLKQHQQNSFKEGVSLDENNYFGEIAKINFFGKFYELSRLQGMRQSPKKQQSHRTKKRDGYLKASVVNLQERVPGQDHENVLQKERFESPRTRFLSRFVEKSSEPPLPIIIRPNTSCVEINLSHLLLKDDYIVILAEVLSDLPRVTRVNVRGNLLTDKSLEPLIIAFSMQSQVTDIDISENKVDERTATALRSMLRDKQCPCRVLKLSGSDIDDKEVALLMDALDANKSLKELDLSHNYLGALAENSALISDLVVGQEVSRRRLQAAESRDSMERGIRGGEQSPKKPNLSLLGPMSIAVSLQINSSIAALDLSWNKIGPKCASSLSGAIQISQSLLEISLAYNGIGDEGAGMIGMALIENRSIKRLDLSYNRIGNAGSMIIGAALSENPVINTISMAGNAIGLNGGYAFMNSLNYHSCEREIILEGCTFPTDRAAFNYAYPTGTYSLNLRTPRDRTIAKELLRLASIKRGCIVRELYYTPANSHGIVTGGNKNRTKIKLKRPGNPAELMGQSYGPWGSHERRPRGNYTHIDGSAWYHIVQKLTLVDVTTNSPFIIPKSGRLDITFVYFPRVATQIECLNATGFLRLMKLFERNKNLVSEILQICPYLVMESYQIEELVWSFGNSASVINLLEVFTKLLPCIRDTCNVDSLVRKYFHSPWHIKEIQLNLRSLFFVCCNSFTGHYKLDMKSPMDRLCAIRLAEINAEERAFIRKTVCDPSLNSEVSAAWRSSKHGYTSQRGNRNNFRNEKMTNIPLAEGLADNFFTLGLQDKCSHTLEFDYVSVSRPKLSAKAIADSDLNALLMTRDIRSNQLGYAIATEWDLKNSEKREDLKSPGSTPKHSFIEKQPTNLINSFGLLNVTAKMTKKFINKRSHEGIWLTPIHHSDINAMKKDMRSLGRHVLKDISDRDIETIHQEVISNESLYYVADEINRFVARIVIRIHSSNISMIAPSQAQSMKHHERLGRRMGIANIGGISFSVIKTDNGAENMGSAASNQTIEDISYVTSAKSKKVIELPPVEEIIEAAKSLQANGLPIKANKAIDNCNVDVETDQIDSQVSNMLHRHDKLSSDNFVTAKYAEVTAYQTTQMAEETMNNVYLNSGVDTNDGESLTNNLTNLDEDFNYREEEIRRRQSQSDDEDSLPGKNDTAGAHNSSILSLGSGIEELTKQLANRLSKQIKSYDESAFQPPDNDTSNTTTTSVNQIVTKKESVVPKEVLPSKVALLMPVEAKVKSTNDPNVIDGVGTILEICSICYSHTLTNSSHEQKRNRKHSIYDSSQQGSFEHTGSFQKPQFKPNTPIEQQLSCLQCQTDHTISYDFSKSTFPTHKRFQLSDDAYLEGSEIFLKVKLEDASTKARAIKTAKAALVRLFSGFGVHMDDINISHTSSVDSESDGFSDNKVTKLIVNHSLIFRLDASFRQVSAEATMVAKTSLIREYSLLLQTFKMKSSYLEMSAYRETHHNLLSQQQNLPLQERKGWEVLSLVWKWRSIDSSVDRDVHLAESNSTKTISWMKRYIQLRLLAGRIWLTAYQAAKIISEFPSYNLDGQNYRETIAVILFSRIIDIENFEKVLDVLPPSKHSSLYDKLGFVNVCPINKITGYFDLDLSRFEHRWIAHIITRLLIDGSGIQILRQQFRRSMTSEFIPGWSIPVTWYPEEKNKRTLDIIIPQQGQLICQIKTPPDINTLRSSILSKVLSDYCLGGISKPTNESLSDFHLLPDVKEDYDLLL